MPVAGQSSCAGAGLRGYIFCSGVAKPFGGPPPLKTGPRPARQHPGQCTLHGRPCRRIFAQALSEVRLSPLRGCRAQGTAGRIATAEAGFAVRAEQCGFTSLVRALNHSTSSPRCGPRWCCACCPRRSASTAGMSWSATTSRSPSRAPCSSSLERGTLPARPEISTSRAEVLQARRRSPNC